MIERLLQPTASILFLCYFLINIGKGGDDLITTILRQSDKGNAVPLWTKPSPRELVDLSQQIKGVSPSVFIIGHPDGGYGTGFVISSKHRLIATNAHVADIAFSSESLIVIGNGTSKPFEVVETWYHPGVLRKSNIGAVVRSTNPAAGDVIGRCPDVAVVKVDGVEPLPHELAIATTAELKEIFAKPIGMLGFPGHDTVSWPSIGRKTQATYRQGVVARLSDFQNNGSGRQEDLQFVQHTMANWFGYSGAPIILPNGHVIAINNSVETISQGGVTTSFSYGVRIDCLWELIAHCELDDKIDVPMSESQLKLARFRKKDPRLADIVTANDLVLRAAIARCNKDHGSAKKLIDKAIEIAPDFAKAYQEKSLIDDETELATQSIETALKLDPTDISIQTSVLAQLVRNSYVRLGRAVRHRDIQHACERLLEIEELSDIERSEILRVYGCSFADAESQLKYLMRAVELWRWNAGACATISSVATRMGDRDLAREYQEKRDKGVRYFTSCASAWRLATSIKDSERDGNQALKYAVEACELSEYQDSDSLDTLAAAYAEVGDFTSAVKWQEKAYDIAPLKKKSEFGARLRMYRNGKPYRQGF